MAPLRSITIGLLCVSGLAGCTTPETVQESLSLSIVADAPFSLEAPVLTHPGGPIVVDWHDALRVSLGAADTRVSDDGTAIRIDGNVTVHLEAVWETEGEEYLHGTWTRPAGDAATLVVLSGQVGTVSLQYAAESRSCWREANFFVPGAGVGVTEMQGHDQAECT